MKEIYAYREMIFSLVKRDLKGRYKGSALGFLWTFINPLMQLCVYTLVFSQIMRAGVEDYYLFLFVALIPWLFFSTCLTGGCVCVSSQQDLVKKIYFPREVLPIAFVTSQFINMILSFVVVFCVLLISGKGINVLAILCLPVIWIIEYILGLGITLIVSSVTIFLRDLEYVLGIIAMAWQFLTPVMYPRSLVPEKFMGLFLLNPMTPVIEAYREILYYKQIPELRTLGHAVFMGVALLAIGIVVFSKLKRDFAEEL